MIMGIVLVASLAAATIGPALEEGTAAVQPDFAGAVEDLNVFSVGVAVLREPFAKVDNYSILWACCD
jgi:hypothetical protein